MMKRLLVLILAAAMMLSLTACGGDKDPECGFDGYPDNLEELCDRMQEYLDQRHGAGRYQLKIDNYPMVGETDQTIWFLDRNGDKLSPLLRPMVPNYWCKMENIRLQFYSGCDNEYMDYFGMALIRACDIDISYEDAQTLLEKMNEILQSNSNEVVEETIDGYRIMFRVEPEYSGGYHLVDSHVLTITPIE